MSDTPITHVASIKLATETITLSRDPLPVVYFEEAPSFSHVNGIISVTLATLVPIPTNAPDGAKYIAGIPAILKCNIQGASALRNALNSALLLAQPVENPEGKAN
jgi:hypothetical protein